METYYFPMISTLSGTIHNIDILTGNWHLDKTHIVDEFSLEARMLMMLLIWSGCMVGIVFGLILLLQTFTDGLNSPLKNLLFLEELSAMIRSVTILIYSENIMTRISLVPSAFCVTNTVISACCLATNITTETTIAFMRFIYICNPRRFKYLWEQPSSSAKAIKIFILPFVASGIMLWYSSPLPNSILSTTCINVGSEMAKVVFEYRGIPYLVLNVAGGRMWSGSARALPDQSR